MKTLIQSKIILNTRCDPDTEAALRVQMGAAVEAVDSINACVFEVTVNRRIRYCCWSGGTLVLPAGGTPHDAIPHMTLAGQGAVESLMNLPFRPDGAALVFAELKMGKIPLQKKIIDVFAGTPADAFICFIGDLAGELDGKMARAFNLKGGVEVNDCVGLVPETPPH